MPIQTLKLLNIHPDSKSKKGKQKGTTEGSGKSSNDGSSRAGRSQTAKTTTNSVSPSEKGRQGTDTPPSTEPSRSQTDISLSNGAETPGTPTHRSSFMNQAFSDNTEGSRSRTSSLERIRQHTPHCGESSTQRQDSSTSGTEKRTNSGTQPGFVENMESAVDTGKGLARIVGAGFKSPMDFSLNIAKGFHNVPKLYGAEVRQVDKVTDLQSGIRTAAKVCLKPA